MSRLVLFICISGTILWNLIKFCMNIYLWYAVILPFHSVNPRGQTKVAYVCYKTSYLICISGSIFWNLTKLCMNINKRVCRHFTSEVKQIWHIFKQTYWNAVFRDNILWNQIYKAVYCLKHFKLVLSLSPRSIWFDLIWMHFFAWKSCHTQRSSMLQQTCLYLDTISYILSYLIS